MSFGTQVHRNKFSQYDIFAYVTTKKFETSIQEVRDSTLDRVIEYPDSFDGCPQQIQATNIVKQAMPASSKNLQHSS